MSFIKQLQIRINDVMDGYYANWTPDTPISVGDYGYNSGYRFTRDGNVGSRIVDIEIEKKRNETAVLEKVDGVVVRRNAAALGDAALGKVRMDLKFGSEGSFLYHLKDLTTIQYQERKKAFNAIGNLIMSGKLKWEDDYNLVTEVKQAGKALIIVADSANAEMGIECAANDVPEFNLASAVGNINYTLDSARVMKYEIKEDASILYKPIRFTEKPPGGGPNQQISQMMAKIRGWFNGGLPNPELISLRSYLESENISGGTFDLPDSKSITLRQELVDITSFIEENERRNKLVDERTIERVQMFQNKMHG